MQVIFVLILNTVLQPLPLVLLLHFIEYKHHYGTAISLLY
jgi:hypothetical protein